MYLLQCCFNLSDESVEDAIYIMDNIRSHHTKLLSPIAWAGFVHAVMYGNLLDCYSSLNQESLIYKFLAYPPQ